MFISPQKCFHCKLTTAQKEFDEFFKWNTPDEAKSEFLKLLMDSFSVPGKQLTGIEASNHLFFYKQMGDLIDAAYTLRSINFPEPEKN